jgi:peroxiredoxin Q/BCP
MDRARGARERSAMATKKKAAKRASAKPTAKPTAKAKAKPTAKVKAKPTAKAKSSTKASAKPKPSASARRVLAVGDRAPDLALPSSDGRDVSLSDYRGKHVVVYFYPKDDTPGCTREAQGFRDARAELARRGAVVLGVSKDSVEAHCRFRDKYQLDFPLLSDRDGRALEAYGAWGEKSNYGKTYMGIIRSTVVVAPDGTVKKVFPNVKVDGHVQQVLDAIDA